jgi:uncharacterized protein (DUF2126 family)/transglutaminase-like putative cysteine protease
MTIRVALHHVTHYRYDRPIRLGPQIVRLRPAPHSRTPIHGYSLRVKPESHFENWQQDPHGNFLARLVFPEPARELKIEVDLIAEMTVVNPFDFFVEEYAEYYPFAYESWLAREIRPYLELEPTGQLLAEYLKTIDRSRAKVVDYLVYLNQRIHEDLRYVIRMEPGVQSCDETLEKRSGSCRDFAWLLVQVARHLGLAARFASGYLIQLAPDLKPLEGPEGPSQDFTDLHAWAEIYIPGAGWIGLDATSGLLTGEGHIPLACTPDPTSAAPITGGVEPSKSEFTFDMRVTRIHEDPRVTKPYTDAQWETIEALGEQVDDDLVAGDVRLTMGGEPTFVSVDNMEGEEWTVAAVGPTKRHFSRQLLQRLSNQFATGALLHFGQGKWYPGEPLPRWAFSCIWRKDGEPLWLDPRRFAREDVSYDHGSPEAQVFLETLAEGLQLERRWVIAAYEDPWHHLSKERQLPVNLDPRDSRLNDPAERQRLARVIERPYGQPAGFVLPLQRQWWQARPRWVSGPWPLRPEQMFLLPGDSPLGLRLPLDSLPWVPPQTYPSFIPRDPWEPLGPLPTRAQASLPVGSDEGRASGEPSPGESAAEQRTVEQQLDRTAPGGIIRTALCVETREGKLHVFMPPVERLEDYVELLAMVEETSARLDLPVVIEGYLPPVDPRVEIIKVTPDPGVIEVNTHPSSSWRDLVHTTTTLYEEARQCRLGTEKFDLDGRHTGTGGGNHVVMGGPTPADSPFLRRPDLLKSLLAYWCNHPSLSYLFSSSFIGPTSQAPRIDEGRRDAIYELEIAFQQIPDGRTESSPPWLVDRIFRHLLVDLTGNTHRAEFCIDKLFSPDSSTGRLGLVEFRAFEMPPHARMSLTQQLLLRAMVARFWRQPYCERLVHWGTALHDRFLLPYPVQQDFAEVIADLRQFGYPFELEWFAPHFEFRFPRIGSVTVAGMELELRQAIEPWYVLGEEPAGGATARYVDSSVERLQVRVRGMTNSRHELACNGRRVPLHPTGVEGEFVAGIRYRAWQPPSCLHPTIPVHTPLVFDVVDRWNDRSLGGCSYHVSHPGGRNFVTFPVNAYEAESRRACRFFASGHTGGRLKLAPEPPNAPYPLTLDLRRQADFP